MILRAHKSPKNLLISVHFELNDGSLSVTHFLSTFTVLGHRVFSVGIFSIPLNIRCMSIKSYGNGLSIANISLNLFNVTQAIAALILTLCRPTMVLSAFRYSHGGLLERLRQHLAMAAVQTGLPTSYRNWIRLFGHWVESAIPQDETLQQMPVLAIVFKRCDTPHQALQATLKALNSSTCPIRVVVFESDRSMADQDLANVLESALEVHVALIQAGEVVEAHAIAALRRIAVNNDRMAVYADEDAVDSNGFRHEPIFKPQPSRTLLMSGLLTRGIHLFRREALEGLTESAALWAETVRLDSWLRLNAALGYAAGERVPFLLTHRRHDTQQADGPALAKIVRAHLGAEWIGRIDDRITPINVCPGVGPEAPKVSLVVASTGRLPHVRKCLDAILTDTDYPSFEMVIVISQETPLDVDQRAVLSPLQADARVRVVMAVMHSFNYSRANNLGVANTDTSLVCLLNDDVAPIARNWLSVMVGHLQDSRVGAVGAKLYYPNETVQHGGVIMGLSGLCDHALRFLPRGEPGYGGRGVVDHELSSVTGACLLVRRSVYNEVGGLDEGFATAFNDVDLCMKIRAAGHSIVWSAQAELFHYETVSLKSHYSDEQKDLEIAEIGIVRKRWASVIEDDPFHNPNLSLERNSEGMIAFPPRIYNWAERAGLRAGEQIV